MKKLTQDEYKERLETINSFIKDTETYKKSILDFSATIYEKCQSVLDKIDQRNNSLSQYIKAMNEFETSDKLTSPSDLFPGIRTAAEASDPEVLKQKADEMKSLSSKASNLNSDLRNSLVGTFQDLQQLFKVYQEYSIRENQIYDMWMELAKDMNSIYDVGLLARNS